MISGSIPESGRKKTYATAEVGSIFVCHSAVQLFCQKNVAAVSVAAYLRPSTRDVETFIGRLQSPLTAAEQHQRTRSRDTNRAGSASARRREGAKLAARSRVRPHQGSVAGVKIRNKASII